jgi:hypothetical protein
LDLIQPRRILLCWEYHRRVWREPFDRLAARYDVELHFLAFRTPEEELPGSEGLSHPRSFWRDYPDARSVIEQIEPDEIVFMGLDGAWSIALNHVARGKGIPTALLHHGVLFPPANSGAAPSWLTVRPQSKVPETVPRATRRRRLPALRFIVRSMALRPMELLRVLLWLSGWTSRRPVPSEPSRLESRLPDRYLVTGPVGARAVLHYDGAVEDQIVRVGMPEYDRFLTEPDIHTARQSAILIDTAFTGSRHRPRKVDPAEKAVSVLRLAEESAAAGLGLVLKLHPESYLDTWPPEHPNLVVIRDADPAALLAGTALAIGFTSTLLAPFAARVPLILVRTGSWLSEDAARLETGPIVEHLDDITADLIRQTLASAGATLGPREAFARSLLTELDGRALERLGSALRLTERAESVPPRRV